MVLIKWYMRKDMTQERQMHKAGIVTIAREHYPSGCFVLAGERAR